VTGVQTCALPILTLAKVAGVTFIAYFLFRIYDIYSLWTHFAPLFDRSFIDMMGGYYGWWVVTLELLASLTAIVILNVKKFRENQQYFIAGLVSGVFAIVMLKVDVLLHGFSIPNFSWEGFFTYNPTIQEWSIFLGSIACMILIYMWFTKYIPLFPEKHAEAH
jgi:Ni/Fe-hydrogenase subunit HybB-like protein